MFALPLTIVVCLLLAVDGYPASSSSPTPSRSLFGGPARVLPRFRRREFVQEEVRKTMLTYMTSLKGEITDVVLEEMIDYYNSQTSKLYRLEKEMVNLKNSSMPILQNGTALTDLVARMSKQQRSFASNISMLEHKIRNLTNLLYDLVNEVQQQQKPIQHVRRLVSARKDFDDNHEIPTGQ